MKTCHFRRRLLGTAGLTLALLAAAAPAEAQQAKPQATGNATLVNDQANTGQTLADASNPGVGVSTLPLVGTQAGVGDNSVKTTSRANAASLILTPDELAGASAFTTPLLTAGSGGVSATSGSAIASRQTVTGAQVDADILDSPLSFGTGEVRGSTISLRGNTSDSLALGNDISAGIDMAGPNAGNSAGIANAQIVGAGSEIAARAWAGTDVHARAVETSTIDNGSNLVRSVARGNAADNRLTTATLTVNNDPGVDPTATISGSGEARSGALFAVTSSQSANGTVRASAGNRLDGQAFQTSVDRTVEGSTITSDGNSLGAAAYGNSGTNALDLSANAIETTPASIALPDYAVAGVTSAQTSSARVQALTMGGNGIDVAGAVTGSQLSASGSSDRTIATANLGTNSLTFESPTLSDNTPYQSGEGTIDSIGNATLHSALGTLNAQQSHGAVAATHFGGNAIALGSTADSTTLAIDGNQSVAAASGNSATNDAAMAAGSFGASVDITSLQAGDGNVTSRIGSVTDRADAAITGTSISGSDLSISGNMTAGIATGNNVANTVNLSAAEVGPGDTVWGNPTSYANGISAVSGTALASTQRLGLPTGTPGPLQAITAELNGGATIAAGTLDQSAVAIDNNDQRAEALGNIAANSIATSTASFTGFAGSALSSSQSAEAAVSAKSDAAFGIVGTLTGSNVSLSGNSNVALAELNDADNAIALDTAHATGDLGQVAQVATSGAALGEQVLGNYQQASGTVSASAISAFDAGASTPTAGSSLAISGNTTSASAAANRSSNAASVLSLDAFSSIGLGNAQSNSAAVLSSAQSGFNAAGAGADGSQVALNGNLTSATARANSANNQLSAGTLPGASPMLASVSGIDGLTEASAVLLNAQSNTGDVMATASSTGAPAGATPSLSGSNIALGGNSIAASGYGNIATNAINAPTGLQVPNAAITNIQSNSGMVNAFASQTPLGGSYGALGGTSLTLSGNSISATAVGNQAASLIGTPR